jgi:tetratricopeptide (TPR) repeat protein
MRKIFQASFFLLATLAACTSTKEPTAQQSAMKQWNDARSAVLVGLASDQYNNTSFEKSRSTIDQALRLSPDNAGAHLLSAKLYIEAGSLEAAERELEVARQLDPRNAEAEYLSGVVYQRWQQPQRALECYQHACDKSPAELAYVLAKAEMLVAMGHRDDALSMLQSKVTYFEHSGEIRDEVGLLMVQEARYPEAIEMFRRATILSPDDLTIREHLAMALFGGKKFAEAAGLIVELQSNEKYQHRPDLTLTLAQCQLETGQAAEAIDSFQQTADAMPDCAGAWLGLGRAELAMNNAVRAEAALRKSIALDDSNADGHLLLGYALLRQGHLPDAYQSFTRAAQLAPGDSVSLCMVGLTLKRLGRTGEAAQWYQRALQANPGDEMASTLLAKVDLAN